LWTQNNDGRSVLGNIQEVQQLFVAGRAGVGKVDCDLKN
jgi:hypothetical protein